MKISVLMENTAADEFYFKKHGLSFFIESDKNILFDMGPDDKFMENAGLMGIDLSKTDFAVLSHGHYDHGGGLPGFIGKFPDKKVYVSKFAFGDFFVRKGDKTGYIGIDKGIEGYENIVLTEGFTEIDENTFIFSDVMERKFFSSANKALLKKEGDIFSEDDFRHEQDLIVKEDGKTVLFSGCAHSGVINIVEKAKTILGRYPDYVFSGFHLYNPRSGVYEPESLIRDIGNYLKNTDIKFFTGHCTGPEAYNTLKSVLGDKIDYVPAGRVVEI